MSEVVEQNSIPKVLSIGGIDSRSGGGIMSDYSIFRSFMTFPFTIVTSIVSVFDNGVKVSEINNRVIEQQIKSIEHLEFSVIKVAYLPNVATIKIIIDFLHRYKQNYNPIIIFDPVISFKESIESDIINLQNNSNTSQYLNLILEIVKLSTIITPNLNEWNILRNLFEGRGSEFGSNDLAVIIKDIDSKSDNAIDRIYYNYLNFKTHYDDFSLKRLKNQTNFGAGCTFSAIISALVAKNSDIFMQTDLKSNDTLFEITQKAKRITYNAIQNGINIQKSDEIVAGPVGGVIRDAM